MTRVGMMIQWMIMDSSLLTPSTSAKIQISQSSQSVMYAVMAGDKNCNVAKNENEATFRNKIIIREPTIMSC